MLKKVITMSGVVGFTFIGLHLDWIEKLFDLGYCFGRCVTPWLLVILICILIYKREIK